MVEDKKITYTVVSETAGHKTEVETLPVAAENIFKLVRNKAMECAINGEFIRFGMVDELQEKLRDAVGSGYSINIFDEVIGG